MYLIIPHHYYHFYTYTTPTSISPPSYTSYNIIRSMRHMIIYAIYAIDSNIEVSRLHIDTSDDLYLKLQKNRVRSHVISPYLYTQSSICILYYMLAQTQVVNSLKCF